MWRWIGLFFSREGLEISSVSPPEDTTYVIVRYHGKEVLRACHQYCSVELPDGREEFFSPIVEVAYLERGKWETEVERFYRNYFWYLSVITKNLNY